MSASGPSGPLVGNLRDIDFALSCMDVLAINAQISIN